MDDLEEAWDGMVQNSMDLIKEHISNRNRKKAVFCITNCKNFITVSYKNGLITKERYEELMTKCKEYGKRL